MGGCIEVPFLALRPLGYDPGPSEAVAHGRNYAKGAKNTSMNKGLGLLLRPKSLDEGSSSFGSIFSGSDSWKPSYGVYWES